VENHLNPMATKWSPGTSLYWKTCENVNHSGVELTC